MAKKMTAAKKSSVPPSNATYQLAAEAWLKQQLDAWKSLQVDIPESTDEIEETRNQDLKLWKVSVADTPSEFGTDSSRNRNSNELNSNDFRPKEKPVDNPSADVSDSIDVANRVPHQPTSEPNKRADLVDHPASTGSPKDVVASASLNLQPATNPCLVLFEGGSKTKPGSDPVRTPTASDQPRPCRDHPGSDLTVKTIENHDHLLPSMVKAPDKHGHLYFFRFHPDYGGDSRIVPSGQYYSQQLHERQHSVWHPKVPPDIWHPVEGQQVPAPGTVGDCVELPQPGGVCSVPPKRKPHLQTDRAYPCAPTCLTASGPLPLHAATVVNVNGRNVIR